MKKIKLCLLICVFFEAIICCSSQKYCKELLDRMPVEPFHPPAPPGQRPSCAKPGSKYCTDIENYPYRQIRRIICKYGCIYENLFVSEKKPPSRVGKWEMLLSAMQFNVSDFMAEDDLHRSKRQALPDISEACPTKTTYIAPKAAQTLDGDWVYVVNLDQVDPTFTQTVRLVQCTRATCTSSCDSEPGGCVQKRVQKRLLVLDPGGKHFGVLVFEFPCSCVCTPFSKLKE